MKETFLTRNDDYPNGPYDSIAWAYQVHVGQADNLKAQFAILYGNEDSPDKIEFFDVNNYMAEPIEV